MSGGKRAILMGAVALVAVAAVAIAAIALVTTHRAKHATVAFDPLRDFIGPSRQPHQRWTHRLDCSTAKAGGETDCSIQATPQHLLVIEERSSDQRAVIHSYDPVTGTEQWHRRVGYGADGAIGVGTIVVHSDDTKEADSPGHLSSLDPATGRVRWSHPVKTGNLNLAVRDGEVLTAFNDGPTTVYRASDGKVLWSRDGLAEQCGPYVAVVTGLGFGSMDTTNAAVEWHDLVSGRTEATIALPTIDENFVEACSDTMAVVSTKGSVSAYRLPGGQRLWRSRRRDLDTATDVDLIVRSDEVVVDSGSTISALAADTGHEVWTEKVHGVGAAYDDGTTIVRAAATTTVHDATSGKVRYSATIAAASEVDLSRTTAYSVADGRITAYTLPRLRESWFVKIPAVQDHTMDAGRVFVLTNGGTLIAYG